MAASLCPRCGQSNAETGLFCTKCGAALSAPSPPPADVSGSAATAAQPPGPEAAGATRELSPPVVPAATRPSGGFPWLLGCLGAAGIGIVGLVLALVVVLVVALPKSSTQALGGPVPTTVVAQPQTVPTQPAGVQPQVVPTQPAGVTQTATGAGQPTAERMLPYMDPGVQFSINYPVGWQIASDAASGVTLFYKDSPEGTSFGIAPSNMIPGVTDGLGVIDGITADNVKKNRDYVVTRKSTTPLTGPWQGGGTPESGYFEAAWTNAQGVKMRASVTFLSRPSAYINTTFFTGIWYQAPVTTWAQLSPTFTAMSKSVKFYAGQTESDKDKERGIEILKKLLE